MLCIDNNEDTCALISKILDEYEVIAEHSKAAGLVQAATETFDLMLIDLRTEPASSCASL